jgi:hypothetical protein
LFGSTTGHNWVFTDSIDTVVASVVRTIRTYYNKKKQKRPTRKKGATSIHSATRQPQNNRKSVAEMDEMKLKLLYMEPDTGPKKDSKGRFILTCIACENEVSKGYLACNILIVYCFV